jgi:hypothetical protein
MPQTILCTSKGAVNVRELCTDGLMLLLRRLSSLIKDFSNQRYALFYLCIFDLSRLKDGVDWLIDKGGKSPFLS